MANEICSTKNAALSKRDALRLLELIHASIFCTTDREFTRIIEDVKTLVNADAASCLRGPVPGGSTRDHVPRAQIAKRRVARPVQKNFPASSTGGKRGRAAFLTAREREILQWVKEGKSTWAISSILGISPDTVKFHVKNIFRKLNATSRSQAIVAAFENGLIDL